MSGEMIEFEIARLTAERDNWQQQAQLHYDNLQRMIGKCDVLVAERDAALVEVRSQLAEIRVISVDRDSAQDHNGFLREKCQKLEAERDAARAEVGSQVAVNRVIIAERDIAEYGVGVLTAERDAAQAERNVAGDSYKWMVKNRDEWQQRAEAAQRAKQQLADALQTEQARISEANGKINVLTAERDAAERERTESRAEVVRLRVERDAALTDLRQAEENNHGLMIEVQNMRTGLVLATEERDNWQNQSQLHYDNLQRMIRKADMFVAERDAAQNETHELRKQYAKLHAEAEGLRADLLAHPPETHTELAAERQRHLELMEDYDRQNVMIGILEDAVKRAENALKVAQAKHVNPRIPGYAATIAQLASQIEDLLS